MHKDLPVQSLSCVRLLATSRTAAHQASLSITNSWSLLKHVHQVSDAHQLLNQKQQQQKRKMDSRQST